MAPKVVFAGEADERDIWMSELKMAAAAANLDVELFSSPDALPPRDVDYLLYAPAGPIKDLSPYSGVKAVLSLWAGVEEILAQPNLPDVPIARMVEPGLTIGMRDYVVGHVYRAHLRLLEIEAAQTERRWEPSLRPPLPYQRRVGILGLGELGRVAATALRGLDFHVSGWSRSPKEMDGVQSFAGLDALDAFLQETEILVVLLPLTDATRGILDQARLSRLPRGAHLINAGRGPLVIEQDLIDALQSGHLASATLDVFDAEPLPPEHPYWSCPGLMVTPHIASVTRAETAAKRVMQQIAGHERGAPIENLIDRRAGY